LCLPVVKLTNQIGIQLQTADLVPFRAYFVKIGANLQTGSILRQLPAALRPAPRFGKFSVRPFGCDLVRVNFGFHGAPTARNAAGDGTWQSSHGTDGIGFVDPDAQPDPVASLV